MKKIILFALVCAFAMSVSAKSKIDRTVFGCTLGVTTSQQADGLLAKQGTFKIGGTDMVVLFNPKYADQRWLVGVFQFEDNVLSTIMFLQSNTNIFARLFEGIKSIPAVTKLFGQMFGDAQPQELDPLYKKLKQWAKNEYGGCTFREVNAEDVKKNAQLPKRSFLCTDGGAVMGVVSLSLGESMEILTMSYMLK